MGFHTENKDFTQFFILDQSEKRLWQLGLAADVLREAVSPLSCSTPHCAALLSTPRVRSHRNAEQPVSRPPTPYGNDAGPDPRSFTTSDRMLLLSRRLLSA